jgi:hypothetical protein
MATIIDNVSLASGAITSDAVTSNPDMLRIKTVISGAEADEYVVLSVLVDDVPMLNDKLLPFEKKIFENASLSLNFASINSASIKVVLTPGAAGHSGTATVTTYEG